MNKEVLLLLFENLLYVRLVEERICDLYSEQEMRCPVHISIGQEATAVGVCVALRKDDLMFSNHRSHGHYLAKGGDLKKFVAELYGKATGCSKGKGGSMHLVDLSVNFIGSTSIVGGVIPLAVGAAFTQSIKNSDKVVVVFLGDAASEEGVFYESINFAKLKNLPVLFFCENNLYSVYTPLLERQYSRKIIDVVKAQGLTSYEVDGNDAVAVYDTVKEAVEKIRNGGGPAFIESPTYRWREHCGPNYDNNIGYRTEEEFLQWKERDPVKILKEKLIRENLIDLGELLEIENKVKSKMIEALNFAKLSPFPNREELDKYTYAD